MSDQAVRDDLGLRLPRSMAMSFVRLAELRTGLARGVGATLICRRKGTQTLETRQLLNCGRCNSTGRPAW